MVDHVLAILAAARLATAPVGPVPSAPREYASRALREFVARAAAANREPPPTLDGYRAHVETEFGYVVHDTLGREQATQVEELDALAAWARDGRYALHVVGYRTQALGLVFSGLNVLRGWTVPTLYGDRLSLGAVPALRSRDSVAAVHPLAADRDRFYTFSGGDTVTVLHTAARDIPIVRVRVRPAPDVRGRVALFDGEIYLDATRAEVVRMRGVFELVGVPGQGLPLWARLTGAVAVAYVEFVNAEVNGRYWLPAFQRTEFVANVPLLGADRAVFRVVSRFSQFAVDTGRPAAAPRDTAAPPPLVRTVTWAPSDSLSAYDGWTRQIGRATASVNASDFADLAPDAWRRTGPPRLYLAPSRPDNILRYDRVEGAYTGLAATVRFRNAMPGLSANAYGGWAWTERTVRGGASAALGRGEWMGGVRAERLLASTNDFSGPVDYGAGGVGALVASVDDADYVDRRLATASLTRLFGTVDRGLATLEVGAGADRDERARLLRGAFAAGSQTFRPNRNALPGDYALARLDVQWHPNMAADFVEAGLGARLRYTVAAGQLAWQRAELDLSGRQYWGPFTATAQLAAGAVAGRVIPPQQLFEIGGFQSLSGYSYKAFAGDRAALFGSFVSYVLPVWHAPHRVWRWVTIPGLAPGFALGAQGGWTELSSAAARTAVDALGAGWSATPVSRATGGVRASVGAGVTFFSGTFHVGVARPVDHAAPWALVAGFGRAF
ncbi:MAG: hypothetical protein KGN74_04935 [Gemmatimonadota bacterium]|nr:hypothetical protein [Gemmatimonadota bacterium]